MNSEILDEKKHDFDPTDFIGLLSSYNFDLEDVLQQMRNQWTRDLLSAPTLNDKKCP